MLKTFVALQESAKGWMVGYGGNQDRKIHWGLSFSSLPGAMGFIKKQTPGKLIVVMSECGHIKKCRQSPSEHMEPSEAG